MDAPKLPHQLPEAHVVIHVGCPDGQAPVQGDGELACMDGRTRPREASRAMMGQNDARTGPRNHHHAESRPTAGTDHHDRQG